jgi:hypothetical protein
VEGYGYAIRLPANAVLQRRIAHLLTRPVAVRPTRSGASTPASATRLRPGAAPAGWSLRSSGTLANLTRVSGSSSRTCLVRQSGWWPSTMGEARRSSGLEKARTPSDGHGCPAG